jgi:N-acetylglucosaminyldiphosphoundecaprenol N-acetyl-beta-D-mannosaminyltransferase
MKHRGRSDTPVIHGIMAAFDFLTGRVRQAPPWMQSSGLEWAYRLYREPRRLWRRYLIGNARFIHHAVPELIRHRIPWGSAQ